MRALAFSLGALALVWASASAAETVKGLKSYTTQLPLSLRPVTLPEQPVWMSSHTSFATSRLDAQSYVRADAPVIARDGTRLFEAGTIFARVPSAYENLVCTMSLARPKGRVGNFCFADTNRDGVFEQGTGMGFLPGFETLHIPKTRFALEPVRFSQAEGGVADAGYPIWLQVSRIEENSATFDLCLKPDVKQPVAYSNAISGFEPACLTGGQEISLRKLPARLVLGGVVLEVMEQREGKLLIGYGGNASTGNREN